MPWDARLAGRSSCALPTRKSWKVTLGKRFGTGLLVITRPLPVLAEACVLLMGTTQLSWLRFLLPVALANLVIAMGSSLGSYGREQNAVPVLALSVALRYWP